MTMLSCGSCIEPDSPAIMTALKNTGGWKGSLIHCRARHYLLQGGSHGITRSKTSPETAPQGKETPASAGARVRVRANRRHPRYRSAGRGQDVRGPVGAG